VRTSSGNLQTDRTYTGQKQDGTGLLYYNARYYDPALGTFLSPDTIVPDASAVIDYNRFLYARANPLKYNDPSGHCITTVALAPATGGLAAPATLVVDSGCAMAGGAVLAGAAAGVATAVLITKYSTDALPDYPVQEEYEAGRIGATEVIPGASTVRLDTPVGDQPNGNFPFARPNQQGNRGADPAFRKGGQRSRRTGPPPNRREREIPDPRADRTRPDMKQDVPRETPDEIMQRLSPKRIGWPRFLLAKGLELLDGLMGQLPQ
jgi:RHS repeat-associated protein